MKTYARICGFVIGVCLLVACASSPGARVQRAIETDDQEALALIASYSSDIEQRLAAVAGMSSQSVILEVVQKPNQNKRVRLAAVKRLQDEQMLLDLALHHHDLAVRLAAVAGLREQQSLIAVVVQKSSFGRADTYRAANARIVDRQALIDASIASIDASGGFLDGADRWLHNDWAPLVAVNEEYDTNLRRQALRVMDTQAPGALDVLIAIMDQRATDRWTKDMVFERITDEQFHFDNLMQRRYSGRTSIQEQMAYVASDAKLIELAKFSDSEVVRCQALLNTRSRELLRPLISRPDRTWESKIALIGYLFSDPTLRAVHPDQRLHCSMTEDVTVYQGSRLASGARPRGQVTQKQLSLVLVDADATTPVYTSPLIGVRKGSKPTPAMPFDSQDAICASLYLPETAGFMPGATCPARVEEVLVLRRLLDLSELNGVELERFAGSEFAAIRSAANSLLGKEALTPSLEQSLRLFEKAE